MESNEGFDTGSSDSSPVMDLPSFRKIIFETSAGDKHSEVFQILKPKKGRMLPREHTVRFFRDKDGKINIAVSGNSESFILTYAEFIQFLKDDLGLHNKNVFFQQKPPEIPREELSHPNLSPRSVSAGSNVRHLNGTTAPRTPPPERKVSGKGNKEALAVPTSETRTSQESIEKEIIQKVAAAETIPSTEVTAELQKHLKRTIAFVRKHLSAEKPKNSKLRSIENVTESTAVVNNTSIPSTSFYLKGEFDTEKHAPFFAKTVLETIRRLPQASSITKGKKLVRVYWKAENPNKEVGQSPTMNVLLKEFFLREAVHSFVNQLNPTNIHHKKEASLSTEVIQAQETIEKLIKEIKSEPLQADGTRGYWRTDARIFEILKQLKKIRKHGAVSKLHKLLIELNFRGKQKKKIAFSNFSVSLSPSKNKGPIKNKEKEEVFPHEEQATKEKVRLEKEIEDIVQQIKEEPLQADGTRGFWGDDERLFQILKKYQQIKKMGAVPKWHQLLVSLNFCNGRGEKINFLPMRTQLYKFLRQEDPKKPLKRNFQSLNQPIARLPQIRVTDKRFEFQLKNLTLSKETRAILTTIKNRRDSERKLGVETRAFEHDTEVAQLIQGLKQDTPKNWKYNAMKLFQYLGFVTSNGASITNTHINRQFETNKKMRRRVKTVTPSSPERLPIQSAPAPQRISEISEVVKKREKKYNDRAKAMRRAKIEKANAREIALIEKAPRIPKNSPLKKEYKKLREYVTKLIAQPESVVFSTSHENADVLLSQIAEFKKLKTSFPAPGGGRYLLPTVSINVQRLVLHADTNPAPLADYRSILRRIVTLIESPTNSLTTPQFKEGYTTLKVELHWDERRSTTKGRGHSHIVPVTERYFVIKEGPGNEVVNYDEQ